MNTTKNPICLCYIASTRTTQCTSSCLKYFKNIYFKLNSCLIDSDKVLSEEELLRFSHVWSSSYLAKYPHVCDYLFFSIYHYCAADGNIKLLKCIMYQIPNLLRTQKASIILQACKNNQYNFIKYLLEIEKVILDNDLDFFQALFDASIPQKSDKLIELLLKHGARPNGSKSTCNMTPLRHSIYLNRMNMMQLFLKYGADPQIDLIDSRKIKSNVYFDLFDLLNRHLNANNFKYLSCLDNLVKNPEFYRKIAFGYLKTNLADESIEDEFKKLLVGKSKSDSNEYQFLIKLLSCFYKPKRLTDLCRIEIRRIIDFNEERILLLDIPSTLKKFLKII